MKLRITILLSLLFIITGCFSAKVVQAQHADHHEHCETEHVSMHTSHQVASPAGIMGDHVHSKGSWMFSYMYMGMQMDGLYDGRSELNSTQLNRNYEMTPDNMFMQMHMIGAMYAVSNRVTLMAMVPFLQKEMGHFHTGHQHHQSSMNSAGLGDIKLSAITPLYRKNGNNLILNGGIILPTGSIDVASDGHMGMESRMGYGMQLGSGTTDLHGLISYSGQAGNWGFGSQVGGLIRLGNNSEQYRHGNSAEHSVWLGRQIAFPLTATVRLNSTWQDHIHGQDSNINPAMIATADPYCYGGLRSRAMGGLNLQLGSVLPVSGTFGVEAGAPIYQNLNGPQMGESWMILSAIRISL
ncbi:transporter [Rhodohalobacter sp. SW132]|uniref:transporter n=1 Tax=Rhodohalobacter sp. SW132 TaxID=2293433 RepID=UPI000E237B1A|nr:transporter [Rhodohalobacter sp. SW132]REL32833.1 transporter [Rhodohalobacter sp. SW132]